MKKFLLLLFFCIFFSSVSFAQVLVRDLSEEIKKGSIVLTNAKGTGASTGASIDGVIANNTNSTIYVDIFLRKAIYLTNSGKGQNMLVSQVIGRDGGYLSDGKNSFIELKPKSRNNIKFIAFCADFEKDNPEHNETFTFSPLPKKYDRIMEKLVNYARRYPNSEFITAAQIAIWLSQGEKINEIKKKINVTPYDERLARQFLE